jgi:hypothetical protein
LAVVAAARTTIIAIVHCCAAPAAAEGGDGGDARTADGAWISIRSVSIIAWSSRTPSPNRDRVGSIRDGYRRLSGRSAARRFSLHATPVSAGAAAAATFILAATTTATANNQVFNTAAIRDDKIRARIECVDFIRLAARLISAFSAA